MSTAFDITPDEARERICELCRLFYGQGWVSGTGGGISIRAGDRIVMAPSGVQKERIQPADLFELDLEGEVLKAPAEGAKLSECAPLFLAAYRLRGAGAVLHSHSVNALLATLAFEGDFRVTHLEMMKGIRGHGYHDELRVPIIRNTARECELTESLTAAIEAHPKTQAVLVERHGVYVWGRSWAEAKTQAECYDYLFEAAVKMKQLGLDPAAAPERAAAAE
ncbi:MAG TPA: methylthioribulose 1-phosphate dehydratase [Polyangiaceae bacterium LLY-WYZ-15_(1-7)]|nr:methylthioribulose 1-phosphate dehydratase [Myxococcales bacterium]MAT26499.1 methylthioribulose 1-phosphate dehydratase [Sandaracinus sp.]HJK95539.1 methylthioribulose 1-phosphate dehydratase [Polyangiaceae bacterium LLY-WYZ-15_(1-7)]HJK99835.1 methylthioribulose 1-phosphate dehydratase [Polyangiaceae bacterium LLY-WYZ-15_(1-7)]HJL07970.1 methylthioribulose 1-phosphate dehydratase [Polyangiaceae bacterium LLY-WYZ-15_(1-7)]